MSLEAATCRAAHRAVMGSGDPHGNFALPQWCKEKSINGDGIAENLVIGRRRRRSLEKETWAGKWRDTAVPRLAFWSQMLT